MLPTCTDKRFIILPMGTDFAAWLNAELKSRGWSQSDLSRKSGITTAHISRIVNRERMPGVEFCRGISRAFGISDIQVLEIAGLATDTEHTKFNPLIEATASMLSDLSEEDQEDFRAMVRARWERAQRKKPRQAGSKP